MRNIFTLMALTLMVTGCIDANPYYEGQNVVLGDAAVPSETDGGTLGDDAEDPQSEPDAEAPLGDAVVPDAAPQSEPDGEVTQTAFQHTAVPGSMGVRGCFVGGPNEFPVALTWGAGDDEACVVTDFGQIQTVGQVTVTAVRANSKQSDSCGTPCSENPENQGCGNTLPMFIFLSTDNVFWGKSHRKDLPLEGVSHTVNFHGTVEAQFVRVCRPAGYDSEYPSILIEEVSMTPPAPTFEWAE